MTLNQSDVDGVFDLLVEADPVPDPHSIRAEAPVQIMQLRPVHTGSETMQTIDPSTDTTPTSPDRGRPKWMLAAAASVIVVLGVGALLLSRGDDTEEPVQEPVPTPLPTTTSVTDPDSPSETAAVAAARDFNLALAAGDVDAALALTEPWTDPVADGAMFEMYGYLAANGVADEVGDCRVLDANSIFVDAGCEVRIGDPVWRALGITDAVRTLRYFPDGTANWLRYPAPDGDGWNLYAGYRAYKEYLVQFHPDEYEVVCNAGSFAFGTVVQHMGLVLTTECAELWLPLQDDIAAWVVETGFGQD